MKFGELKSIAHNISESLGSGIGLMIGHYEMDIFGEAANSPEGHITVDFLNGATSGARPSPSLKKAISLYSEALEELCQKHGTTRDAFSELKTRFSRSSYRRSFIVTIRDTDGRTSIDEYQGLPARRVMELDELGRIRPKRTTELTKPE